MQPLLMLFEMVTLKISDGLVVVAGDHGSFGLSIVGENGKLLLERS